MNGSAAYGAVRHAIFSRSSLRSSVTRRSELARCSAIRDCAPRCDSRMTRSCSITLKCCLMPLTLDEFVTRVELLAANILPKATTNPLLFMNGSDHLEDKEGLPT